jgi:hypothetical protein
MIMSIVRASMVVILMLCSIVPASYAANAKLNITEATLNRLIQKIGVISDGGLAQNTTVTSWPGITTCEPIGILNCFDFPGHIPGIGGDGIPLVMCHQHGGGIAVLPSGDPVPYQWWITDMVLNIENGAMNFSAAVKSLVDGHWQTTTRTVNARIQWNVSTNKLQLVIDDFRVSLFSGSSALNTEPVTVSRYFSVEIPVIPQTFSVALPNGKAQNVTGRVVGASPVYTLNNLEVNFDVAF